MFPHDFLVFIVFEEFIGQSDLLSWIAFSSTCKRGVPTLSVLPTWQNMWAPLKMLSSDGSFGFKTALNRLTHLDQNVDFSMFRPNTLSLGYPHIMVISREPAHHAQPCFDSVKRLKLDYFGDEDLLAAFQFHKLESLCLSMSMFKVLSKTLRAVQSNCRSLRELEIEREIAPSKIKFLPTSLHSLSMVYDISNGLCVFRTVFTQCPHLENFTFKAQPGGVLYLREDEIETKLRTLSITCDRVFGLETYIRNKCPFLLKLTMDKKFDDNLALQSNTLQHLKLKVYTNTFYLHLTNLPQLLHLCLRGSNDTILVKISAPAHFRLSSTKLHFMQATTAKGLPSTTTLRVTQDNIHPKTKTEFLSSTWPESFLDRHQALETLEALFGVSRMSNSAAMPNLRRLELSPSTTNTLLNLNFALLPKLSCLVVVFTLFEEVHSSAIFFVMDALFRNRKSCAHHLELRNLTLVQVREINDSISVYQEFVHNTFKRVLTLNCNDWVGYAGYHFVVIKTEFI